MKQCLLFLTLAFAGSASAQFGSPGGSSTWRMTGSYVNVSASYEKDGASYFNNTGNPVTMSQGIHPVFFHQEIYGDASPAGLSNLVWTAPFTPLQNNDLRRNAASAATGGYLVFPGETYHIGFRATRDSGSESWERTDALFEHKLRWRDWENPGDFYEYARPAS